MAVSPSLFFAMHSPNTATPINLVRPGPAPVTIASLHSAGVMSQPVVPMPSFLHGGTSTVFKNMPAHSLPPNLSEFSRADAEVWVYTVWQRKDKTGKGTMSAQVFDAQNHMRVTVAPKTIRIHADAPVRYGFSFPTQNLQAGSYRIDVSFDGRAVWRTFFTIMD